MNDESHPQVEHAAQTCTWICLTEVMLLYIHSQLKQACDMETNAKHVWSFRK